VRWIQKDESRHIAYGIYLIARNLSRNPSLWECVEEQMNKLLPLALGIVEEGFAPYPNLPLPISKDEFISYATSQYQKRYQRLQKARTESLDAVEKGAIELMENA
jgi:ribonucleoside-diphosphate reductase beta chain